MLRKEMILSLFKEMVFKMYLECHEGLYFESEGEYDEEKSNAEWGEWQRKMEEIVTNEDEWLYEMENEYLD